MIRAPRTAAMCAAALAAWVIPGAGAALQYDRLSIHGGALWRLVTGHVAHWSPTHLLYSLGSAALLSWLLERRRPALVGWTWALSAAAIPAALWLAAPGMNTYRGLSGVGCALFAALAVEQGRALASDRAWGRLAALAALAAAMACKLAWELQSGGFLFVGGGPFTPARVAHAAGAAAGLAAALTAGGDAVQRKSARIRREMGAARPQ